MLYKELRKALLDKNLTSMDLCKILNRSAGYISNCMSNKTSFRVSEAHAILDALRLPYEDFYKYFPNY